MQDQSPLFQFIDGLPDIAKAIITTILLINLIAWFFLPFAVYGIKARLNELRKSNEKLIQVLTARQ